MEGCDLPVATILTLICLNDRLGRMFEEDYLDQIFWKAIVESPGNEVTN